MSQSKYQYQSIPTSSVKASVSVSGNEAQSQSQITRSASHAPTPTSKSMISHSPHGARPHGTMRSHGHGVVSINSSEPEDADCFEKASVLIDDAIRGRYIQRDLDSHGALGAYQWVKRLRIYVIVLNFVYLMLAFIEVPSWCLVTGKCGDPNKVLVMGLPVLPRLVTESIEIVIVAFYILIIVLRFVSVGRSDFFRMNRYAELYQCLFLVLAAIDLLVGLINTVGIVPGSFRLCRWLRPAVVVAMSPRLRVVVRNVLFIIHRIIDLIALLVITVAVAAWFAILLYPIETSEGKAYFSDYIEALTSLFIAATTSNHPDVMLRAYTENRAALFFFVLYMALTTFMILNLLLAAVYDSYRRAMQMTLKENFSSRREGIREAFHLLDHNGTGFLDYSDWANVYRHLRPDDDSHAKVLFDVLDTERNHIISEDEFVTVCSVLELRKHGKKFDSHHSHNHNHINSDGDGDGLQMPGRSQSLMVMRHRTLSAIRTVKYSRMWRFLRTVVNSTSFEYTIDGVIFINAVFMGIETGLEFNAQEQTHLFLEGSEVFFTLLYVLEMFLKHLCWGWKKYWRSPKNVFDGVVTIVALITEVFIWVPNAFDDSRIVRVILLTRMLRLFRLLARRQQFTVIFSVIGKLIPAIIYTLTVLACLFYLFAIIGVQLFGGLLYRGNPHLVGTNYDTEAGGYYALNFNDFGSALMTLFSLLIVNNWYVIMEGTVAVSETRWTRIMFVLFYFICVLVFFNLLVSYVLEHFIVQWDRFKKAIGGDGDDGAQDGPGLAVTEREKLLLDLFGEEFLEEEEEEEGGDVEES